MPCLLIESFNQSLSSTSADGAKKWGKHWCQTSKARPQRDKQCEKSSLVPSQIGHVSEIYPPCCLLMH